MLVPYPLQALPLHFWAEVCPIAWQPRLKYDMENGHLCPLWAQHLFDRVVWKCLLNIDFRPIDAFTCPMFVAIKMWLVMNERPHVKGLAKEIEERPSKFELFVMRTISNYCGFISHIYNTWMFIKKKGNLKKVIDNMASVYPICLAFTVLEF